MLKTILKRTVLNWNRPFYSEKLFEICKRYVDMWYGDNNFDRKTNGEYRVLMKIVPNATVVFDVGANIGEYAEEILKINPKAEVHCFEPHPTSFNKLKDIPVHAHNLALSEKEGSMTLFQMERSTHNSFYAAEHNKGGITVPVSTLDLFCARNKITHIDFLKIDVEGHEYAVLRGAEKMLKDKRIDYVQFEFSGASAAARTFLKDFVDIFDQNGYELYRIRGADIVAVVYRPDCERFTLTNYITIRKGASKL
jgi:FkbM family methyltransferase